MWDFSLYMFRERAFSLFWGILETAGAKTGVEAGAQVSRIVLKILCKSSSEYLGILVAASGATAMEDFIFEGSANCSVNLLSNSESGKESGGVTEGATERYSQREYSRSRTEVILV